MRDGEGEGEVRPDQEESRDKCRREAGEVSEVPGAPNVTFLKKGSRWALA